MISVISVQNKSDTLYLSRGLNHKKINRFTLRASFKDHKCRNFCGTQMRDPVHRSEHRGLFVYFFVSLC